MKNSCRLILVLLTTFMVAGAVAAEPSVNGNPPVVPAAATPPAITVKPENVFIVTDGKDLQPLLDKFQKKAPTSSPAPAAANKTIKPMTHWNPFSSVFWSEIKEKVIAEISTMDRLNAFRAGNLYILLAGIILTILVLLAFRRIVVGGIIAWCCRHTTTSLDDKLSRALRPPVELFILAVGIYFSSLKIIVELPDYINLYAARLCQAFVVAAIAWAIFRSVDIFADAVAKYTRKTESKLDDLLVILMRKTLKIVVVIIAVLFIGQNILGLNITTLLAGAGIFGLAVAFAAQDSIANFFGSIIIVIDKPFFVGDRIKVEGYDGIVVNVGFRSTKIQTLDGHLVTLPNKKMTESTVENVSKRPSIRFIADYGLTYDSTPEQMVRAMDLLREIFANHEGMTPEQPPLIFFNEMKDWALNIQVIVWYHPGDWVAAMTWWSKKNLEVLTRFNQEKLNFAFPTNTTHIVNDGGKKFEITNVADMNKQV